ncbi:Do family serine endopeptidase [Ornithobacterium rhinotracheale]|uniref:Do family serine endopeptidase n=1 Tax=Ornithobacterium rhinotracheale TaxID=28251 RepID=UPI00129CED33|nr:Do family serine endopeptidase [Ornithobacterium rhinotracheale]MRJ09811.1 Do family serine endopeptidase [Ornithobacterium rhinotracheale]
MKNILTYALVGVVSAGTTYGLIEYSQNNNFISNQNITTSANGSDNNNGQFATYSYTSGGTVMPDFTKAANESVNAVVSITNLQDASQRSSQRGMNPFDLFNDPFFDEFFGPQSRGQRQPQRQNQSNNEPVPVGMGSGVIISSDGYIVTNNHVVKDAAKLEVTLNNKQSYVAKLIGTDPNTDLALLKIDEDNLPFLSFYNSDNLQVGEWVLAVGNPFGLTSTVTAGIVSAKGRGIGILSKNSDHPIESFIQTDAVINRGNSGGALINTNGHLVGINTAIFSETGSYAGYGFAIPSNLVKKVINDIKNYGMVQRGYVGIQGFDLSDEMRIKAYNKEKGTKLKTGRGIYVTDITPEGGAQQAGIKTGDIIMKIDGQPINTFSTLSFAVGRKSPGDKVRVEILRDGSYKTFDVVLKDLKGNAKIRSKQDLSVAEKLGASFKPLTDKQKIQYGINSGVLVESLQPNSQFAKIGINEGYIILKINGKEVNSEKDINKILKNFKGNVSVNFVDRYGRIYTQGFSM